MPWHQGSADSVIARVEKALPCADESGSETERRQNKNLQRGLTELVTMLIKDTRT